MLDSNGEGLLGAIKGLLDLVFIPALERNEKWGDLSGIEAQQVKQQFLGKLSSFVGVLANAQASVADAVKLSPIENERLLKIMTLSSSEILSSMNNQDMVVAAENIAIKWCHEIEQVCMIDSIKGNS